MYVFVKEISSSISISNTIRSTSRFLNEFLVLFSGNLRKAKKKQDFKNMIIGYIAQCN